MSCVSALAGSAGSTVWFCTSCSASEESDTANLCQDCSGRRRHTQKLQDPQYLFAFAINCGFLTNQDLRLETSRRALIMEVCENDRFGANSCKSRNRSRQGRMDSLETLAEDRSCSYCNAFGLCKCLAQSHLLGSQISLCNSGFGQSSSGQHACMHETWRASQNACSGGGSIIRA